MDPIAADGWHGGNFEGLIEAIPYFKNLGVSALWITPVYLSIGASNSSEGYHGYWAMDFERVDPHLYHENPSYAQGSRQYLADLVSEFHDNGLKVILDVVVNHTGYHTRAYGDYEDKRFSDWDFNVGEEGSETKGSLSGLPDLNHDSAYVRDYFVHNLLRWIEETDIDGLRMDTAKHVEKAFWYYFKSTVKTRCPGTTLIGEILKSSQGDIQELASYQKDHDFDSVFDFPLRTAAINCFVHGAPLTQLARPRLNDGEAKGVLDDDVKYSNPFRLVTLLDNHDLDNRIFTTVLDGAYGGWDRNKAVATMNQLTTFLMTTRGIPQIYYGNEVAMEGHRDPDNRHDFPWHLFDDNWQIKEDTAEHIGPIYEHLRRMASLRTQKTAIRHGYLLTLWVDDFAYVYARALADDVVVVAFNNGEEDMPYPLQIPIGQNDNLPPWIKTALLERQLVDALDSGYVTQGTGGELPIQVPGKSGRVLVVR